MSKLLKSLIITIFSISCANAIEISSTTFLTQKGYVSNQEGGYIEDPKEYEGTLSNTTITNKSSISFDSLLLNPNIFVTLDNKDNIINSLQLELNFRPTKRQDIYFRIGTNDELYGFYSTSDDISATGVTILPQGVYTNSFVHGAFQKSNGINIEWNYYANNGIFIKINKSIGTPYIENERLFERSVTGQKNDLFVNVSSNRIQSTAIEIHDLYDNSIFYLNTRLNITASKQYNWSYNDLKEFLTNGGKSVGILTFSPDYIVNIDIIGIRRNTYNYTITAMAHKLTIDNDKYKLSGSVGGFILYEKYATDEWTWMSGISYAKSDDAKYNSDIFYGASYDPIGKDWILTFDMHHFTNISWLVEITDESKITKNWDILAFTWLYKF